MKTNLSIQLTILQGTRRQNGNPTSLPDEFDAFLRGIAIAISVAGTPLGEQQVESPNSVARHRLVGEDVAEYELHVFDAIESRVESRERQRARSDVQTHHLIGVGGRRERVGARSYADVENPADRLSRRRS